MEEEEKEAEQISENLYVTSKQPIYDYFKQKSKNRLLNTGISPSSSPENESSPVELEENNPSESEKKKKKKKREEETG